jgi:hypothetical protein
MNVCGRKRACVRSSVCLYDAAVEDWTIYSQVLVVYEQEDHGTAGET